MSQPILFVLGVSMLGYIIPSFVVVAIKGRINTQTQLWCAIAFGLIAAAFVF